MSYTTVNYREVDPVAGSMHFPGAPLKCEQLGVTVVECPPGWSGKAHDQPTAATRRCTCSST